MPRITTCPERSEYERMAKGLLSEERADDMLLHLEGCARCLDTVRLLDAKDTLVDMLVTRQDTEAGHGKIVDTLVEKLRALAPLAAAPSDDATLPPSSADEVSAVAPQPIRAVCSCGKALKVKAELAGKNVRCPQCRKPVAVPRQHAPAPAGAARSEDAQTLAPQRESGVGVAPSDRTAAGATPSSGATQELYDFLAPPQQADELGRLGPYRSRCWALAAWGSCFRRRMPS